MTPPTSSRSTFIPRFCISLGQDIVFVRTKSGTYSKYTFDQSTNRFKTVTCTDCHVVPSENDLFPLYASWSNRLERYVIFARNALTGQVEQYVYEKDYEGFQQVYQPELIFDSTRTHTKTSNEFFTVGGTEEEGVTVIKKDSKGNFRKEQMNWGTKQFEAIPAVPVKILQTNSKKEEATTVPVTIQFPVDKIKELLESVENQKENSFDNVEKNQKISGWLQQRKRKTELEDIPMKEVKKENKEVDKKPEESKELKPPARVMTQKAVVEMFCSKPKLSRNDVIEIRRLAALMGNPADPDSSDDADYTESDDDERNKAVLEVEGESFEVIESSC